MLHRMATSGTTNDKEWQRVTASDTKSDNEWQRMTTSGKRNENEWKWMWASKREWLWVRKETKYAICNYKVFKNIDYL